MFKQNEVYISGKAIVDLSAKTNCFVKQVAGGINTAGAGELALGVLYDDPKAGQNGTVQVGGVAEIKASVGIVEGAEIASAGDGRAVTAAAGQFILGIALKAANAANEIIPVQLNCAGKKA